MLGELPDGTRFPYWPVAMYVMNEGSGSRINDLSGNGNTGTLNSAVTWGSSKFGFGLNINEGIAPIRITHNSSINIDAVFTLSMWFKIPSGAMGDNYTLFSKLPDNVVYIYVTVLSATGKIFCRADDNVVPKDITSINAVNDGLWHHLIYIRDSSGYSLYVDNVLNGTNTNNGSIATTHDIVFGAKGAGTAYDDMLGQIDNAALWKDVCFTAQQIAYLYWHHFPWFEEDEVSHLYLPVGAAGAMTLNTGYWGQII